MNTLPASLKAPHAYDPAKVNILVVDDLPEKHLVFGSVLEELQQNVIHARSGKEALRLILKMEFAVILLDVNMPDIDGLETGKLIRQYKKTAQTPILFITAYVDELQAIQGYALGAVDYISTPVVPGILRSKVKVFVDLYRMNRQLQEQMVEREALARSEAARSAAEDAIRRANYLSTASERLSRSLNTDATVHALFQIAVPELADLAAVAMLDGHGELRCTEILGLLGDDAPAPSMASDNRRRLNARMVQKMRAAMSSRELALVEPMPLWDRRADAVGMRSEELLAGVGQIAVCPLFAGERPLGVLLLFAGSGHFQGPMLALIREVVGRASIAMENARLYTLVQDADRRKNEFLAMLAHELRNPLAPIRNAVRIMQGAQVSDPTVVWVREVIGRQVDHMSRMVDDLLDVSRIARGKVTVQNAELTLADLFERAVEASEPLVKARQQELSLQLPEQPVVMDGDIVRLSQVLSNLLNNASKFTPPHGQITLSAEMQGQLVRIRVKDNGDGIDPEFLPHMFDLFAQGDQALDRSQGGLGIGLTLVRHLVELHGGQVQAFSEGAGQGAEITVSLPARVDDRNPELTVAPLQLRADPRAGSVRVLVVDDLLASAETMKVLLESEGYVVEIAGDGPTALEKAVRFQPDVVILDIGLPGMSGFEVAQRMRELPETREALLIALTGYGEAESRLRSQKAGFDHHVVKPADIDFLFDILASAGQRSQQAVE